MKIEIEVNDLTEFISALNNALIVYGDIISSIRLGCEPSLLIKNKVALEQIGEDKLKARYDALVNVHMKLEEIERRMLNDQRRENHEPSA